MVIDDLDLFGTCFVPNKADAPLIVDSDAVLTRPVSSQQLQSVSRRGGQVAQLLSLVKLAQFALRYALNVLRQMPCEPAMKQGFGLAVGK